MLSAISKYIVPSFLQRFDRYLLVHHPHLWRTRGHYFSFYTLITAILMFLAGYFYPQNLYDLISKTNIHKNLPIFVTFFGFFAAIAVIFGGWYAVQKFQYSRVKWNHLLAEIGIYAVCLSLLWATVFGFLIGYQYRTAYHLAKNIEPNQQWLKENQFFKAAYVPHYQLNKLDDLNLYFKQGDSLMFHLKKRFDHLTSNGFFKGDNGEVYYNYDDFEYYEYLTPPPYNVISAPYKNVATYYEAFFAQEIGLDATQKPYFTGVESTNDHHSFAARTMPYLTAPTYRALIEQIHPKKYRHIDVSNSHQQKWQNLFDRWAAQKTFLDQLSVSEQKLYLDYLKYLRKKLPDVNHFVPSMEYNAFEWLKKRFKGQQRVQIGLNPLPDEVMVMNTDEQIEPSDAYMPVVEQALFFIKSLSPHKKTLYANYVQLNFEPIHYTHYEGIGAFQSKGYVESASEIKDYTYLSEGAKSIKTKSLNFLRKKFPKATLQDSIIYFDTYFSNTVTDITPIFQQAYAEYFVEKYSSTDLKRLETILKTNGFPTKNADWGAAQQNLYLLRQGADLEKALDDLPYKKRMFEEMRLALYSFFSVMCCILAAIVFYIMTISNGIQFWTGIFIGGFAMIFIIFILNIIGMRDKQILPILVCTHLFLFIGLIVTLFFSKYQWQRAKQTVNSILFSGIVSVVAASSVIASYLNNLKHADANYNRTNRFNDDLFIFTNVIVIAIFIYLIIAYLLKRHLSLPKRF
jgi:hypothetical protein